MTQDIVAHLHNLRGIEVELTFTTRQDVLSLTGAATVEYEKRRVSTLALGEKSKVHFDDHRKRYIALQVELSKKRKTR